MQKSHMLPMNVLALFGYCREATLAVTVLQKESLLVRSLQGLAPME